MFAHLNLKQKVSKAEHKRRLPALQWRLFDLQQAVFRERLPVALVFEGWAAAGKGGTITALAERLDPRGLRVVPITPPRTLEQQYPWLWRFWLRTPAYGQMVVFDTSWYRRVLIERLTGAVPKRAWQAAYDDILDFERQLADDGAVILKFWLHIARKEQGQRFKKLLADKLTAWQVTDEDAAQHAAYKKFRRLVEEMLARTEASHAPWTIVEATDRRFTQLKVLETIVRSLEARLGAAAPPPVDRGLEEAEAAPLASEASVPAPAGDGAAREAGAEAAAPNPAPGADGEQTEAGDA